MDEKTKYESLVNAFSDETFRRVLETEREEIVKIIQQYVSDLEDIEEKYKILFSVESRVKTVDSFMEKIRRKNYVQTWEITGDMSLTQEYICNNLPDLIGIRVNCYFWENEEKIYEAFVRDAANFEKIVFDFSENKIQKNGHKIYKFTAKYDGRINFEIQIKSVMHNVWGEVEHKTVYKNRNYDGFVDNKRNISEVIYDILQASDKQLVSLYKIEETDEQLLRSLFFNRTREQVTKNCGTDVLANHYTHYFNLFPEISDIKKYVVCVLEEKGFERTKISVNKNEESVQLAEKIKREFSIFDLKCIYEIDSILHEVSSFDDFVIYLVDKVIVSKEIIDEFDEEFESSFDDSEEDMESSSDKYEDYINKMTMLLGGTRING